MKYLPKKKKKRYLIIYGDSVVPAEFRNKVDSLINGGIKFFLLENHFFFQEKLKRSIVSFTEFKLNA